MVVTDDNAYAHVQGEARLEREGARSRADVMKGLLCHGATCTFTVIMDNTLPIHAVYG